MKTVETIADVRAWRRSAADRVGLVPTMGYLHEGHLSLVLRARAENERVAASLFVNPTQFGPNEDLARYPRDLARDQELLAAAGCDLLLVPSVDEMYPRGTETTVDAGSVSVPLEGERRPGHFRGVATVVLKLFGIFEPTHAYFGEKDAQQLAVIRKMVRDLDVPVIVRPCPTVRETDGLAMSSRNSYLGPEDRAAAPVLYRALQAAEARWNAGERRADALRGAMSAVLSTEPRARVDYAAVADPETFAPLAGAIAGSAQLLLAVHVGPARLIDNVRLDPRK
jgi:pantoate--beta-alanine ligase